MVISVITKRLSALLMAAVLIFLCTGCRITPNSSPIPTEEPTQSPVSEAPVVSPEPETYTLNECVFLPPDSYNPHIWKYAEEQYVAQYAEMPLVDISKADDGGGFDWVYEMAISVSDITAEFELGSDYGITEAEGRVFEIALNREACWEDGTAITAETYIYSMQQLLSPEMKNYRAEAYYDGPAAIYNAKDYYDGVSPWSTVGLYAADEYTLIYITQKPVSMFAFLSGLTVNWLVRDYLYEGGKHGTELVFTDYGSSADTYMSYGPYKLISADSRQLVFTRSESWYGYTDGKHEGQYQTTDIVCHIIPDPDRAMELFNEGIIDTVELTDKYYTEFRGSEQLLKLPESYMYRFVFASDLDSLIALEQAAGDGSNKRVLHYDDFRRAISLSIDREIFCDEGTTGYEPGFYLLNDRYYCDIENNSSSVYRDTEPAKRAMCELYGVSTATGDAITPDEAYASIRPYDPERARELFQSAYNQAVADGNYTPGQPVSISCICSADEELSDCQLRQQELLNFFVSQAAVGTGFEGMISFTYGGGVADRYSAVANGELEMITAAWGSSVFYPFSFIRVFSSPLYMGDISKVQESNGWNPAVEPLEISADFDGDGVIETNVRSFESWAEAINDPAQYAGNTALCIEILAQLEVGILDKCLCIPWGSANIYTLYSGQLKYASKEYDAMYGFGSVRQLTYNYSDSEWLLQQK